MSRKKGSATESLSEMWGLFLRSEVRKLWFGSVGIFMSLVSFLHAWTSLSFVLKVLHLRTHSWVLLPNLSKRLIYVRLPVIFLTSSRLDMRRWQTLALSMYILFESFRYPTANSWPCLGRGWKELDHWHWEVLKRCHLINLIAFCGLFLPIPAYHDLTPLKSITTTGKEVGYVYSHCIWYDRALEVNIHDLNDRGLLISLCILCVLQCWVS